MKKISFLFAFALLISGVTLFLEQRIPFLSFERQLKQVGSQNFNLQEAPQEIVLPPPLRGSAEQKTATLSHSGVFFWTNEQRKANGLPALDSSMVLDAAAEAKLSDMFLHQYFAHVSPAGLPAGQAGRGVADWAKDQHYEFITIGENLALGNYKDDKALVQDWMDSPGHRANILNTKYREIGIAVGKGNYEGSQTWLAVQIFGLSLAECPSVDSKLHADIENKKAELDVSAKALDVQYGELKQEDSKNNPDYAQNVKNYNSSVDEYNKMVTQVKILVEQYNAQILVQQACLRKAGVPIPSVN